MGNEIDDFLQLDQKPLLITDRFNALTANWLSKKHFKSNQLYHENIRLPLNLIRFSVAKDFTKREWIDKQLFILELSKEETPLAE